MFEFAGGALSVNPSDYDTTVSFEIFNVGDESGAAEVGCEIDGTYITSWTTTLDPNVGDRPTVSLGARRGRYAHGARVREPRLRSERPPLPGLHRLTGAEARSARAGRCRGRLAACVCR